MEKFYDAAGLHMPVIFRFLLSSLRNRDLAETLTQECFLRAFRNRATFRGESSVKSWLMRIAINLRKDYGGQSPDAILARSPGERRRHRGSVRPFAEQKENTGSGVGRA
jgi:Sigma-70 region 2